MEENEREKEEGAERVIIGKKVGETTPKAEIKGDYNKNVRSKIDNVNKRNKYKDQTFDGKKTTDDVYTGAKLHSDKSAAKAKYGDKNYTKHIADVDHTVPLETVYKKAQYNPFLSVDDIKEAANIKQNYKVINAKTNRGKGSKSNSQYAKDNKGNISKTQKSKMKTEEIKANIAVNTVLTGKTIKNVAKVGGKAAVDGAKFEAAISSVRNIKKVASGESDIKEAVIEVGMDSVKAGARSFGTGVATRIVESTATQVAQKTTNKLLAEGLKKFTASGGPGKAIVVITEAGSSLKSYLDGDINETELVIELGEKGTGLAASFVLGAQGALGGAAAGALIGGILGSIIPGAGTVAGAAIGGKVGALTGEIVGNMVGYMLGTELYNVVKNYIASHSFDPEKARRMDALYSKLADEIHESRLALEQNLKQVHLQQQQQIMNGFTNMHTAILENNYDAVNNSLAEICKCFEVQLAFETQDEFDDFMLDDSKSLRLGKRTGVLITNK
ncbi:hypothetical protein [Clostridium fungisolvens]|uniref:Glycine zipper domain-containing protein n=1 Tax=Clostridium fungisolvens TaxID=1604897 RepID=A0A6V8SGS1_9CLOT|nr:hypothetical protein [Clostridium fungisolvens]GFP76250.1 hypothetical protein bsdtw1_02351 [Clostridium fungisolvens]